MIVSRWQLVLAADPLLHPLAFARGEASEEVIKRKLQSRKLRRALAAASRLWSRPTKKISCFPAFLIHSAFGRTPVIARSQLCRLEFQRRICAQYLPAIECSRAMPDSSAHNRHAFQNQDS